MSDLNYRDLVRAIDDAKHSRRKAPQLPIQRHRTRHILARSLHQLADRLDV
jgi:hypothetical protein